MKLNHKVASFIIVFSLFNSLNINAQGNQSKLDINTEMYKKSVNEFKQIYHKDTEQLLKYKHFNRWNEIWGKRANAKGKLDMKDIMREIKYQEAKEKGNQLLTSKINWSAIGPLNTPVNDEGLGRVNVVKFHPNNSSIIYIGTASGGAWVSYDNGKNWQILPTTDYLSLAISDIEISKNNPNVIYISTSDPNAANAVSGSIYGIGVLKSTDAGKSFFATQKFYNLEDRFFTNCLAVNPENENIVWVGTDRGVYKSIDGGLSFTNYGPNVFVKDIELHPTNPDILYISSMNRQSSTSAIFKSIDGGEKWDIVQNYGQAVRAEIAVSPAKPDRVVTLVSQNHPFSFHSLNLSDNSGDTWVAMSDSTNPNILGRNHGTYPDDNTTLADQGWYDLCVAINPKNSNEIITGGIWLWSSNNAGKQFFEIVKDYHVDQHYIEYTPSGDTAYIGNDGGLYRYIPSTNKIEFVSSNMNITQFYKLSVNSSNLNMIVAGAQDNNSMLRRANQNWYNVRSGDGMDCHFDPKDPNYIYVSSQYGNLGYSVNNGSNFRQAMSQFNTNGEEGAWVTPFAVDPQKTGYVYAGYYNIWRSKSHGQSGTWEKISNFGTNSSLKLLTIAKSNSDYIYCSEGGSIRFSSNGGNTWGTIPNPGGSITEIEVHPTNPQKLFVSCSNYSKNVKVFEYDPTLKKWNNLSGNLPNIPINTIKYQKNSPDRLYVGTDIGVFYTDYNSRYWERYGKGLPYTIVTDIDLIESENKIYISTFGRGIWAADLINCNYAPLNIELEGENDFCFGDSVKLKYTGSYNDPNEIQWSTGEKGLSIWVKDKGSYSASRIVTDNCSAKSNFIEITLKNVVDLNLRSSAGDSLCAGDSLTISANFGQKEYLWDDGSTKLSRLIKEPGTYHVQALNKNGCYSYDTITIYQKVVEKPTITQQDSILTTNTNKFVQWYFNGVHVEGANSSTFKPVEQGEVMVEVRDGYCNEFSDKYDFKITSVDELSKLIKIYPNPSNGSFNIEVKDNSVISDIIILDLKGNIVYNNSQLIKNNLNINLDNITNGIYLLRFKFNNFDYSTKINIVK